MITIVDYGMGNLGSIKNMIKRIGYESVISNLPKVIEQAEIIILPGVGRFDCAMGNLNKLGIIGSIKEKANSGTPLLGICLGMQLLSSYSEEGNVQGLDLIPGIVRKFNLPEKFKIPHMGWNYVDYKKGDHLFANFESFGEARFYFVHSYHFSCENASHVIGSTTYGKPFASVIRSGNIQGVQFHPEKSHKFGMQLLKNLIECANV